MGHAYEKDGGADVAHATRQNATSFAGFIGPIRREKTRRCARVYTILNPPGKRAERHNDPTPALPTTIRMRIADAHIPAGPSQYIHTHIGARARARNTSTCVSGGENRPRSKACPWHVGRARAISDNLFRKQWKRMPRRASADEYSGIK